MESLGYIISVLGLVIVLIWIGLFKFTPTEAKDIEPYITNSPFMNWLYSYFDIYTVSKIIGTLEIITGVLIFSSFFNSYAGLIGGIFSTFTFLITLSFIFSTPNSIERIDNFILPDAFILKDIMPLGISIHITYKAWIEIFG